MQIDQENPESLPTPKYMIKSQYVISSINFKEKDTQLSVEEIRLRILASTKKASNIWDLKESEIV